VSTPRERILAKSKAKRVPFYVDEWEETVFIRMLSVDDQAELSQGKSQAEMVSAVLIASLEDEEGTPIFLAEDDEAIRKMPFIAVLEVFGEAAKLNGLTNKELEEAMESFRQARIKSGPTDSPSPSAVREMNSETSAVPS
jgi:hypothetical protein